MPPRAWGRGRGGLRAAGGGGGGHGGRHDPGVPAERAGDRHRDAAPRGVRRSGGARSDEGGAHLRGAGRPGRGGGRAGRVRACAVRRRRKKRRRGAGERPARLRPRRPLGGGGNSPAEGFRPGGGGSRPGSGGVGDGAAIPAARDAARTARRCRHPDERGARRVRGPRPAARGSRGSQGPGHRVQRVPDRGGRHSYGGHCPRPRRRRRRRREPGGGSRDRGRCGRGLGLARRRGPCAPSPGRASAAHRRVGVRPDRDRRPPPGCGRAGRGAGADGRRRRLPGVRGGLGGRCPRTTGDAGCARRDVGGDRAWPHLRRDGGDDGRLRRCGGRADRSAAMKLFDVLSRQRRLIYLVVAVLSAAGVWATLRLPSAIYPELEFSRITVVAQGSTLGARQVVFSITRPLEEAVSIVPGVTRVRSHSIRGAVEMQITFAPRTDMAYALQLVRARVNQIQGDLPVGLDIEVERLAPSLFPILSYNLEGGDPATLYDIARYEIKPLISRVPGVGRVDVMGSDVREIEVIAEPARLAQLDLTYTDLADAIRRAVTVQAVGRVAQDYRQYLIVTDQEAHSPDDIGGVVVKSGLRVRDLAMVRLGTEDHVRIVAGDGKPAALLNITRPVGGNSVRIADHVARIAATPAPGLPPGVHLKPVYDQAALVRDAVTAVRDAMLVGATLAVIVLLLFLRHGLITAISATSIPLTLAITMFVMSVLGQSFNLMTLGAMAIAIGLVIDDAVVVTENIARHLALGGARVRAIREAVQELIWPVTTSTI